MVRTIQELKDDASIIKNETDASENTASRVGTMFLDIIEYLGTLNTSSDSEDEGGSGGGGGGGISLNEPLSSINNMASTPGSGNKVLVCQNGIWAYGDYGGGSTPTSGVTWSALAGNTSEQINLSHLTTALNSCSFWGRHPVNGVVSGDMINVGSITMNGKNHTFLIDVDDDGNLRFNGNIYATGGVSALGNSSSGGGGGGGTDLGTFLSKLNNDNPSLSQGYLYYSGGNNGTFYMTAGGGGSGLTPGNLAKALDGEPVPTRAGYLYFNGSNYSWENSGGSSNLPIATNNRLGGIKVGNTLTINADTGELNVGQMDIPKASSSVLGGVIVGSGSGLNVDNYGKLSLDSSNITASKLGTAKVGSSIKPIYLNYGTPTECNTYAGGTAVTLNGGSKAGTTADFYAPTRVGNSGYVLKSNGSGEPGWTDPNGLTVGYANKLSGTGTRTVWGRTYWQDGGPKNVTGDMTSVGSITMSGYIYMNNNTGIGIKDYIENSPGTHGYLTVLGLNNTNNFFVGYGTRLYGYKTEIQGGNISFITNNDVKNDDSPLAVGAFYAKGQFHVKQGDQGVRIGDGVIKWNSKNNSLYVERAADAGGGVANFYASGGVSALGFSSTNGRNARVSYLIADSISVSGDITDQDSDVWHIDRSEFYHSGMVEASEMNASRFYIIPKDDFTPSSGNTNCILYVKKVNGVNKLYFYNGSSEIQIAEIQIA